MASNMFIKFKGIDGGSTDSKHDKEIEVMSWNHGFSQPTSPVRSTAGSGTVEQANHSDFSFTKYLDSASDDLIKLCWNGKHVDDVTFTAYRSDGETDTGVEYLKIKMTGVVISNFSIGGGPGDMPVENVSLSYGTVQYTYTSTDKESGSGGGNQPVKHDLTSRKIS